MKCYFLMLQPSNFSLSIFTVNIKQAVEQFTFKACEIFWIDVCTKMKKNALNMRENIPFPSKKNQRNGNKVPKVLADLLLLSVSRKNYHQR